MNGMTFDNSSAASQTASSHAAVTPPASKPDQSDRQLGGADSGADYGSEQSKQAIVRFTYPLSAGRWIAQHRIVLVWW